MKKLRIPDFLNCYSRDAWLLLFTAPRLTGVTNGIWTQSGEWLFAPKYFYWVWQKLVHLVGALQTSLNTENKSLLNGEKKARSSKSFTVVILLIAGVSALCRNVECGHSSLDSYKLGDNIVTSRWSLLSSDYLITAEAQAADHFELWCCFEVTG